MSTNTLYRRILQVSQSVATLYLSSSVAFRGHPLPAQFAIGCESLHNVKQVRLKEINLEPTLSQDRVLMHVT